MTRLPLRLALLALLGLFALPGTAFAGPFGSSSIWNAPLRFNAPLASDSTTLVAGLQSQLATTMPWMNTYRYSTPVYQVGATQPKVRVTLDKAWAPLQADLDAVPLPPAARPADGSDGHLVVVQPSTDTVWEFWRLSKKADGWHAGWGGKLVNASKVAGWFQEPRGASASGLPMIGGLMRTSELRAGKIDHAIDIALPEVRAGSFVWPAQRTDGRSTAASAVPMGTRFRLPASLDINALNLPPAIRTIAVAAQRYGFVVRDGSVGAVVLFAEDPVPTGANPYPALFGTSYYNQPLAQFPWAKLQAVAPTPSAFVGSLAPAALSPAAATPATPPAVKKPAGSSRPTTPAKRPARAPASSPSQPSSSGSSKLTPAGPAPASGPAGAGDARGLPNHKATIVAPVKKAVSPVIKRCRAAAKRSKTSSRRARAQQRAARCTAKQRGKQTRTARSHRAAKRR